MFLNPNIFFQFQFYMRNLQEQVKKAFCYQKLFWPFTVWINCSSDLKSFANSQSSASNFKSFSWSLEQFFLTIVLETKYHFSHWLSFMLWVRYTGIRNESVTERTNNIVQSWHVGQVAENWPRTYKALAGLIYFLDR